MEKHRILEHKKALETKDTSYGVARHWLNDHPDLVEPPLFTYKVSKVCRSSIERQIWEGIEIATSDSTTLLNEKGEWGSNLPPKPQTIHKGQIWDDRARNWEHGVKEGNKRGIPPEPDPGDSQEVTNSPRQTDGSSFGSQYSQRKRQKRETERQLGFRTPRGKVSSNKVNSIYKSRDIRQKTANPDSFDVEKTARTEKTADRMISKEMDQTEEQIPINSLKPDRKCIRDLSSMF